MSQNKELHLLHSILGDNYIQLDDAETIPSEVTEILIQRNYKVNTDTISKALTIIHNNFVELNYKEFIYNTHYLKDLQGRKELIEMAHLSKSRFTTRKLFKQARFELNELDASYFEFDSNAVNIKGTHALSFLENAIIAYSKNLEGDFEDYYQAHFRLKEFKSSDFKYNSGSPRANKSLGEISPFLTKAIKRLYLLLETNQPIDTPRGNYSEFHKESIKLLFNQLGICSSYKKQMNGKDISNHLLRP